MFVTVRPEPEKTRRSTFARLRPVMVHSVEVPRTAEGGEMLATNGPVSRAEGRSAAFAAWAEASRAVETTESNASASAGAVGRSGRVMGVPPGARSSLLDVGARPRVLRYPFSTPVQRISSPGP